MSVRYQYTQAGVVKGDGTSVVLELFPGRNREEELRFARLLEATVRHFRVV